MALVSGKRSTLNPNAPLFVPAAMREVEDFSPEWWDLMATSNWFKNYWLSQHHKEDILEDNSEANNVAGLLPDSLDLDVDEHIFNMETQFEEFLQSSEPEYGTGTRTARVIKNGFNVNRGPSSRTNYWEKQGKQVSSRSSPRFIQQHR